MSESIPWLDSECPCTMWCTYTIIEVGCQLVAHPTSSGSPIGGPEVCIFAPDHWHYQQALQHDPVTPVVFWTMLTLESASHFEWLGPFEQKTYCWKEVDESFWMVVRTCLYLLLLVDLWAKQCQRITHWVFTCLGWYIYISLDSICWQKQIQWLVETI